MHKKIYWNIVQLLTKTILEAAEHTALIKPISASATPKHLETIRIKNHWPITLTKEPNDDSKPWSFPSQLNLLRTKLYSSFSSPEMERQLDPSL